MVKCVVMGAQGSGGSYLVDFLLNIDPTIEIFAPVRWRSNSGNYQRTVDSRIKLIECDLVDLASTIRFLKKAEPNLIFHLAAHANVRASFDVPLAVFENNTRSTQNLLEALRLLDMRPKFIMASTSEVYGHVKQSETPILESQRLNPVSPYAASKVSQEMLALSYLHCYELPIIITRMFTYLNPRRSDLFATSFIRQIIDFKRGLKGPLKHGNLASVRSILDIRDSVNAYWLASKYCEIGEIYNIGGSNIILVGEFLNKLLEVTETKMELYEDPNLIRPADVVLQIPNSDKFRKQTGWSEKYDLTSSISFLVSEVEKIY